MLNKHRLPQVIKYLLAVILGTGCYGLYLLAYGDFVLSLFGASVSLLMAALIYRLDVRVKAWTHNRRGKLTVITAVICLFYYFTFSGYFITRGGHELLAKQTRQAGTATERYSHSGRRLVPFFPSCKFVIQIRSPMRRDYCASKEEFDHLPQLGAIDKLTMQTKVWVITNDSALGSTIVSIEGRK